MNTNGTLTASQIIAIVQARPELIVDIKQVMADYLEQQGSPIQADSITDDMLYRGIGSDAGLRGAITIWLRARGYVSESDFDKSALDPTSSDDVGRQQYYHGWGIPKFFDEWNRLQNSAPIDLSRTQIGSAKFRWNSSKEEMCRDSLKEGMDRQHLNLIVTIQVRSRLCIRPLPIICSLFAIFTRRCRNRHRN